MRFGNLLLLLALADARQAVDARHAVDAFGYRAHPLHQSVSTGEAFLQLLRLHSHSMHTFAHNPLHVNYGRMEEWTGAELIYLDNARRWPIYSQTAHYCPMLFLSGMSVRGNGSLVVEMGTLSGGSSRCLAAGLAVAARTAHARAPAALPPVYLAFDAFSLFPKEAMRNMGFTEKHPMFHAHAEAVRKKRSYKKLVWKDVMVRPVYSGPALPLPGDIGKTSRLALHRIPPDTAVEVWAIDSAKTHDHFIDQAADVWPRLRVGSIIHLMDFAKAQNEFWISEFVLPGDVSVASVSLVSASWSFVVNRAPLDWGKVLRWPAKKANLSTYRREATCRKISEFYEREIQRAQPPPELQQQSATYQDQTVGQGLKCGRHRPGSWAQWAHGWLQGHVCRSEDKNDK